MPLAIAGTLGMEESLERFLLALFLSLTVTTLSRTVAWLRPIPYTLLLTIAGLVLSLLDVRLARLSPDLTLFIFLPPLLFESSWNLQWQDLRRDLVPVTLFATVGVLVSIAGIGWAAIAFAGLSPGVAWLVGAGLAATDPVATIALLRELKAKPRLTTLLEGESLLNDGVAVVAFSLLLGAALGTTELTAARAAIEFVRVVGVGIGLGAIVGFGISYLTQRFDLPLIEQSLTLLAAYGTYLAVEKLGGSGVMGVVTVGLVLGNFGSQIGMAPHTRQIVTEFWHFAAFFLNSILFLLLGDQVEFELLVAYWMPIAIGVAAVLLTRFLAIASLATFSNRLGQATITWKDTLLLWWGGLRGSVAVALALSIPGALGDRTAAINITFGVVLFTLLAQGLTAAPLLQSLNLVDRQPWQADYERALIQRIALNRVLAHLVRERQELEIDAALYDSHVDLVRARLNRIQSQIVALQEKHPQLKGLDIATLKLQEEMVAIEARTYSEFSRAGILKQPLDSQLDGAFRARRGQE